MHRPACATLAALFFLSGTAGAAAPARDASPAGTQPGATAPARQDAGELVVCTKAAPPFAFRGPDGRWTGISIELWSEVADDLGLKYRLVETTLEGMIDEVADGRCDAAVGALTITEDREERVDFTFPFYSTGFGIAVDAAAGGGWSRVLRSFLDWRFLMVVAGLLAVVMAAGAAVWFLERRRNPEHFRQHPARGLGDGFWWAAVTLTTVGYGDKAPVTAGGRLVAMIWMLVSMVIVASLTATITASLTVGQIKGVVQTISDLSHLRVGTIGKSAAAERLADLEIPTRSFAGLGDGFQAIIDGHIDAFVYDWPLVRYAVREGYQGRIKVLPQEIGRQHYGIALPEGSNLREPLNRALLARVRSPEWRTLVARYLGREE